MFRDEPLTLMNGGACPLTISNITSSAPDFLVPEVVTYPIVVAAGGSAEVEIRFQPTSFGSKSATLTVTSDDPVGPRTLTLSGTAPSGHLVITGSGHFGSVELGQRAERTVSICNDGECDLHVSRAAFKPDPWKPGCRDCDDCDCDDDEREEDRSDQCCATFKIVNNPFPATVKPGACLGVLIRFVPTCDGRKCCKLVIESDDPQHRQKTILVTGRLRRTLRSALKCWAAEELHQLLEPHEE